MGVLSLAIVGISAKSKANQPGAKIQQALISQLNENSQSGIQTRERRGNAILEICNSYLKPSLAAEQEASCKRTTAVALEKQAALCKNTTAIAVEKEAGVCKKLIADAFNMTMEMEAALNAEKEKEAKWCKKNSVIVEKVGPFKPSKENKIGVITKYYHNYEFSMDLRFGESDLQRDWTQLLVVSKTSSADAASSLFYLWSNLRSDIIIVHFYAQKHHSSDVNLGHKSIVFLNWHKLQAIQSSNDGVNCKQEIRINGKSIWSQSLKCPRTMKNTQQIYLSGSDSRVPDAEVKNFRFFSQPLICGEA